jgi:carotenoid cleavage dioxygenase-like enzyme
MEIIMTNLDRRQFLTTSLIASAAVITPDMALAGATPPGWALGVADVEADVPLEALQLVQGKVPAGLSTTLFRNGPAKFRRGDSAAGHWFDGDGLVRRWHVRDGQATLNARYAETAVGNKAERDGAARLRNSTAPRFGGQRARRYQRCQYRRSGEWRSALCFMGGWISDHAGY